MKTYTIITEYKGGTYVSQHRANDVNLAIKSWSNETTKVKLNGMTLQDTKDIANELKDEDNLPIELNNMKNVWFVHLLDDLRALFIHIICTCDN